MEIIILLSGRIGNILFQLAHGYEYAKMCGCNHIYVLPTNNLWARAYFSYSDLQLFPLYYKIPPTNFILLDEKSNTYTTFPLIYNKNVMLRGYFCSEFYHKNNLFVNDFFKSKYYTIREKINKNIPDIVNRVGISVRRGDYISNKALLTPKIEWYKEMFNKYFKGRKAIVFSDDIEYCKEHLSDIGDIIFTENKRDTDDKSIIGQENDIITNAFENLYTLAMCKDHICSPSTYSWWGCKLFEEDNAVNIFPNIRYVNTNINDSLYIPERWIKESSVEFE